jgi:hypothetical protein
MEHKTKVHSVQYLKRQAARLKKQLDIPHHEALEIASRQAGFQSWKHFLSQSGSVSCNDPVLPPALRRGPVSVGTLVRLNGCKELGIVYSSRDDRDDVEVYSEWGPISCVRGDFAVCRDQSSAANFMPMRLYLPYGRWYCANGCEVLHNRNYKPIWVRQPDGKVETIEPDVAVMHVKEEWFFSDLDMGPVISGKLKRCTELLKEWGVEARRPAIMESFAEVIRTGNPSLLKETDWSKTFPVGAEWVDLP